MTALAVHIAAAGWSLVHVPRLGNFAVRRIAPLPPGDYRVPAASAQRLADPFCFQVVGPYRFPWEAARAARGEGN